MRQILPIVISVLILVACDPCTNCDSVSLEPTVSVKLINADSLMTIQDSVSVVDTLIVVVDSLNRVNAAIEDGELGYEDEKALLEEFIDSQTNLRLVENDFRGYLVANRTKMLSIIRTIESGSVLVSQIDYSFSDLNQTFEDSTTLYELVLSSFDERTDYLLYLDDQEYDLRIDYVLKEGLNLDHQIVRRAFIENVQSALFDSLKVECEGVECLDGETVITCYF